MEVPFDEVDGVEGELLGLLPVYLLGVPGGVEDDPEYFDGWSHLILSNR